ncbi:hypothetical protein AAU61_03170 [Desulfocarbo indianensis]|nr:hypothetical protein AAU61_03170 [Desulfocarbo indianensis]
MWRVTYLESGNILKSGLKWLRADGMAKPKTMAKPGVRCELRNGVGEVIRLARNGEFKLIDTPYGEKPELYGEVALLNLEKRNGKYRTSCYIKSKHDLGSDLFIKPLAKNVDEFQVFRGEVQITEYDEANREYTICVLEEGQRAQLKHEPRKTGRARYVVTETGEIPDKDHDYFLSNYLDVRKWRV